MAEATAPGAPSYEELARRGQRGCIASFEELVRRFQVPLLQFLDRLNAPECEDLVQETFIRAYENLHRYRSSWHFSTWLFTIARRLSSNQLRKKRPRADSEALEAVEAKDVRPSEEVSQRETKQRLWDTAASVLSEQQNTALWLYYVEEMDVQQIAQVLGRSRGSVKTMLFRARKKLQSTLDNTTGSHPNNLNRQLDKSCPTPAESYNG